MRTNLATNRQALPSKIRRTSFAPNHPSSSVARRHPGWKILGAGAISAVMALGFVSTPAYGVTTIDLGSATPNAIVAGSTITNTGSSVVTGDVGLFPGTSITGFPPGTVTGTSDAADGVSHAAQTSSTAAYGVAATDTPFTTIAGGTLGGTTLVPGVYKSASALALNGTVTLNGGGDPNSVFIFQAGSTLITASSSSVVLEGGAQACNVFWQVGSSATLGTTTSFVGTILALTSVTLNTGASVDGRLLAQTGAVTLNDNTITVPTCAAAAVVTTTTAPPTTTVPTTTVPVPTTTVPVATKAPVTLKHHAGAAASTTPTTPGSSPTIVPVGAPATGEGGMAGSGFSPLGLIALGAVVIGGGAASVALRLRSRR